MSSLLFRLQYLLYLEKFKVRFFLNPCLIIYVLPFETRLCKHLSYFESIYHNFSHLCHIVACHIVSTMNFFTKGIQSVNLRTFGPFCKISNAQDLKSSTSTVQPCSQKSFTQSAVRNPSLIFFSNPSSCPWITLFYYWTFCKLFV
jgi:hypothetical protein